MNKINRGGLAFYTDGACSGNPGKGGFGVICIEDGEILHIYSKQCENTTNNREELKAILHVLKHMYCAAIETTIFSDSAYCVNMLNKWIWDWAENDWKNSKGREVENIDLVKELYHYLRKAKNVMIVKVDGHSGILGNELADALATNNETKFITLCKENNLEDF